MLVDSNERAMALDINHKLIKAPAGSGKTGLLTNYFLKLLSVTEHPRQIQAMTFTNAAAQEMKHRIISSLSNVKNGISPKNSHEEENYKLAHAALRNSQARGWNLESNPSLLQICTIDSFCRQILADNARPNNDYVISRNVSNDPSKLYETSAKETLNCIEHKEYGNKIKQLLFHFNNNAPKVERLLIEMLELRERWIPLLFENRNKSREALEKARREFISVILMNDFLQLQAVESELIEVLSKLDRRSESLAAFCENGFKRELTENKGVIQNITNALLTRSGKAKSRFTKKRWDS